MPRTCSCMWLNSQNSPSLDDDDVLEMFSFCCQMTQWIFIFFLIFVARGSCVRSPAVPKQWSTWNKWGGSFFFWLNTDCITRVHNQTTDLKRKKDTTLQNDLDWCRGTGSILKFLIKVCHKTLGLVKACVKTIFMYTLYTHKHLYTYNQYNWQCLTEQVICHNGCLELFFPCSHSAVIYCFFCAPEWSCAGRDRVKSMWHASVTTIIYIAISTPL